MATCSPTRRYLLRVVATVLALALISSTLPLQAWSPLYGVPMVQASSAVSPVSPVLTSQGSPGIPPEQTAYLRDMGLLAPDGQPTGLLMDIGAAQTAVARQPEPVANPLSVSRVQSAYCSAGTISGTLVITFTVTNNLPPLSAPSIPSSSTVTDTIAALSGFDFSKA